MSHKDKTECAAAQKKCQVYLGDQTAIEQIEFVMMDVLECNQSLLLAVTVIVFFRGTLRFQLFNQVK